MIGTSLVTMVTCVTLAGLSFRLESTVYDMDLRMSASFVILEGVPL